LVATLASDGVDKNSVIFDPIENTRIAVSKLELSLSRWPPQAETVHVLNGGVIFAERGLHRRPERRPFSSAERLELTDRIGAKLDRTFRQYKSV
jgi:hypothetical protein